jgi:hypothetical protein
MIVGRLGGLVLLVSLFDRRCNEFAGHDFRLAALLLVEGIGELAALILDRELALASFQHQDLAPRKARVLRGGWSW